VQLTFQDHTACMLRLWLCSVRCNQTAPDSVEEKWSVRAGEGLKRTLSVMVPGGQLVHSLYMPAGSEKRPGSQLLQLLFPVPLDFFPLLQCFGPSDCIDITTREFALIVQTIMFQSTHSFCSPHLLGGVDHVARRVFVPGVGEAVGAFEIDVRPFWSWCACSLTVVSGICSFGAEFASATTNSATASRVLPVMARIALLHPILRCVVARIAVIAGPYIRAVAEASWTAFRAPGTAHAGLEFHLIIVKLPGTV
jgi:hypothetical protein